MPVSEEKGDERQMEKLAEELMAELNCDTSFTIPVLGGIGVSESVVVSWVVMAILIIFAFCMTRNLKVENPGKRQVVIEMFVTGLQNIVKGIIGEEGERYVPYLVTVMMYIGLSNIIGLLGMKPPTKDLNVTGALGILSILLIQYANIRARGTKGWLKSFAQPVAVVTPINILELFIRPLSLCMRLFGNVLGAFVVMELLKALVPVIIPIPFSLYFDIFDGFIQAYVFVFLTSLFIKEAVE